MQTRGKREAKKAYCQKILRELVAEEPSAVVPTLREAWEELIVEFTRRAGYPQRVPEAHYYLTFDNGQQPLCCTDLDIVTAKLAEGARYVLVFKEYGPACSDPITIE